MSKKTEKTQTESLNERLHMVFGHLTTAIAIADNTKWQDELQEIRHKVADVLREIEPLLEERR